jgi:hypothetical protein
MKEEAFNLPTDSYFLSDCISPDEVLEDKNFLSPEVKPENIFDHPSKDSSEAQLSSIICGFPFTLDSFQLIFLKNGEDSELGGLDCKIILGNLENIRFDEPILKLIFFSKDRKSPLNLNDYPKEMNSLTINLGIEFMSIFQNKLFLQCENKNMTNEAYTSLQKSSTVFDLLYDEERSINSLEELNKGINSLLNSDKKSNNIENYSNEGLLSSNKKEINGGLFNKFDEPIINNNKLNENDLNYDFKKMDIFPNITDQKNIWNPKENASDINKNLNTKNSQINPLQNQNQNKSNSDKKDESNAKQKYSPKNQSQVILPPQLFPPLILPLNNFQKIPPNPSLMMPIPKINPFLLQTALLMQNLFKIQQINQKPSENKDKKNTPINNILNFNGKNENQKINNNSETENFLSSINKESSTNSNTSSTSSKESSPSSNYQIKNNTNINFNFPNANFPLFNGINIKTPNNTIQYNNNNNIEKDIINNAKEDDKCNNNNPNKNDEQGGNNSNLEDIVLNKKYKEYIPKNKQDKEKDKENDVKFHTNSTRDYQFKYVSRYIVQIENEKNFPVTKMIIGNNGKLLRQILLDNCINYGDHTTKIRLRGKGSGYKEVPKNEESKDPMELCISSLNMLSYMRCSQAIENLLLHVYYQYYLYQCNNASIDKNDNSNNNSDNLNNKKEMKDKNGCPIIMKKILKYQYVVNRYNTLVKEEKRRKKEEELKNSNQINSYNDNKDCNNA